MTEPRPHLPHILGCAIGFAAAGCGVGSLLGMVFLTRLYPQPPQDQLTEHEMFMSRYGGTHWGMAIGAVAGLIAGVVYAVVVRRKRRRLS